jgi:hypothetical protein
MKNVSFIFKKLLKNSPKMPGSHINQVHDKQLNRSA